jgi:tetratricopeptide (TPR) repeat protein
MPLSLPSKAIKIFFSYAISAPQDRKLFDKLITHLSILRWQYVIDEWYDSAIIAGSNITQVIEAHLNTADIIVLLISADFFASERCYEREMKHALELSMTGMVHLIPVLLSPANWSISPLAQYHPLPSNGTPISLWKNRDAAFTEVAQGIRRVVEEIARKVTQARPLSVTDPGAGSLHDISHRYNAFFTNRDKILSIIASTFTSERTSQTLLLALKGLGGIGKTQIVLEYIQRSSQRYQTILWLNASSRDVFNTEVNTLADKIALSHKDRENEQRLFAAIQHWLQNQTRWLLVLDHLDDMTLVNLIVPAHSDGHVFLTTHTQITRGIDATISIPSMSTEASIILLLRRAGFITTKTTLNQIPSSIRQEAETIANLLDGFPLALDQAGAYLEETGCSLGSYITLFHQERATLLSQRGQLLDHNNHPDSVTVTLSLAIEQVTNAEAVNLELFHLLAFLQADAIPEELLTKGATELHGPLRSLITHPLRLHQALARLRNFSLIQHNADRTMFSTHHIVQAILTDTLTPPQQRQWATITVRMINRVFPEVRFDTRTECERYLPQAQHCATLIHDYHLTIKEGPLLLERLGFYCYQHASYVEAQTYLLQALHLYEDSAHMETAEATQTLNSLALLYHQQAHYQQAEASYQRALEIRERIFGLNHPKTAESLHNLAMLYGDQEKYQQAKDIDVHVLALEERMKGTDHPDVAKTLNNLGLIYYQLGDYTQAETAYQRALTIYQHVLPPNHPDQLHPLDGLGALAETRGDYQRAEEYYQEALTICTHAFGDIHPETAHCLNKLADIAEQKGNYQQAERLYLQALAIGEQTLEPNHPDIALFLNNLATLAVTQGHDQHAQELYVRALSICEQTMGPEHTWVASVLTNLGQLDQKAGRIEQAERHVRRALAIYEHAFNAPHPDIAQSMGTLATLLIDKHAYKEAEVVLQQALEMFQTLDPRHTDIALLKEKYAILREESDREEEATKHRKNASIQQEQISMEQASGDNEKM